MCKYFYSLSLSVCDVLIQYAYLYYVTVYDELMCQCVSFICLFQCLCHPRLNKMRRLLNKKEYITKKIRKKKLQDYICINIPDLEQKASKKKSIKIKCQNFRIYHLNLRTQRTYGLSFEDRHAGKKGLRKKII